MCSIEAILTSRQAKPVSVKEDLLKLEHIHMDAEVFHRFRFGDCYADVPMRVSLSLMNIYKLTTASASPARVAASLRTLKLCPSALSNNIVVLMCSKMPITTLPAIPGSALAHG